MAFWDIFKKKSDIESEKSDESSENSEVQVVEIDVDKNEDNFIEEEIVDDEKDQVSEINKEDDFVEEGVEKETFQEEITEDIVTEADRKGFFNKLWEGLSKTRTNIADKIDDILAATRTVDEEMLEEIEDTLIAADLGMESTMDIIDHLRNSIKKKNIKETSKVKEELISIMKDELTKNNLDNTIPIDKNPLIILVVGVNGVGKTTTIGKMAYQYKEKGKNVLLVAADTFRAAAIEQLTEWANRANVDIVSHKEGADPASVIFDGIASAKAKNSDIIICDTAGRLHNKKNLMNELNKIHRVIEKEFPNANKEVLLVVDGTTGQNAIFQAKEFKEVAHLTGIAITKMDGTAKGGVIFPLQSQLGIPVKLIGVGEQIENLMEFDSETFVEAIVN